MDHDLGQLGRAAASDPTDEAAARRLDAALLRAGRPDEVGERFRFKFQCSREWLDLGRTDRPGVKSCEGCEREVFAVTDLDSLRAHVNEGHCVAFPASQLGHAFLGLSAEKGLHSAREARPPCVVPGGALAGQDEDALLLVPRSLAERYRVAPLGLRGERLLLAVVEEDRNALDELRFMTSVRDVETVLATGEEVDALIAKLPREEPREMLMGDVSAVELAPRSRRIDLPLDETEALVARELARTRAAAARAFALAGDGARARSELEQALADDPSYAHAALWLATLFGDTARLRSFARGDAWPAPLARCLRREVAVAELLASIRVVEDAQARSEQLCEAYGFLGAALDSRGAAADARGCYEACVAQGVTRFVEHTWASSRLRAGGGAPWVSGQ